MERHIHLKLAPNYEFKAAEAFVKKKKKKDITTLKWTHLFEKYLFSEKIFFSSEIFNSPYQLLFLSNQPFTMQPPC